MAWHTLLERLRAPWRRFWSLPWRWKGPTLGAAVLLPLAIILVVLAALGRDDGPTLGPHLVTPTPLPHIPTPAPSMPTPTPSPTPTPTPLPTPTPPPPPPTPTPPPSDPTAGGYRLVRTLQLASYDRMVGFAAIPGSTNEAVIVTQGGLIWRIALDGSGSPALFGDLSGRLISNPGNEEGLLGLAFSPRFQADGLVYVYYTAGEPRRSVLARFRVIQGRMDMESEQVLLEVEQPFSNHNGGQIAFGPDGYLYLALGDGGGAGDPQGNGQNPSTLLGSILRLDVSSDTALAAPDNPLARRPGARPEIYAYGLRNPWRFSFDRPTGQLWAADVGQDRWEEVDLIVAGGNYGWNIVEGFECFRAPSCDTAGLQPPRAVYGHDQGCSITGGFVYRGPSMPELYGWYVYGDFCSGRIWALNTEDDAPPVLLAHTGLPISSFGETPDGELLVLTFANAVYRLERAP